jgi:hypothetical protein
MYIIHKKGMIDCVENVRLNPKETERLALSEKNLPFYKGSTDGLFRITDFGTAHGNFFQGHDRRGNDDFYRMHGKQREIADLSSIKGKKVTRQHRRRRRQTS